MESGDVAVTFWFSDWTQDLYTPNDEIFSNMITLRHHLLIYVEYW